MNQRQNNLNTYASFRNEVKTDWTSMITLSSKNLSWESSRNQLDTIIKYEHKIDQEQEVRVHSMSLPSAFRVDARGSLKLRQVAILAARPAQPLGLKTRNK
jgi:hypothetical protein